MNTISAIFCSFPPCGALLFSSVKRHGGQREKKRMGKRNIYREREREYEIEGEEEKKWDIELRAWN